MIGASSQRIDSLLVAGVVSAFGASVLGQDSAQRSAASDAAWPVVAGDPGRDTRAYELPSRAVGRMWAGDAPLTTVTGYASGVGTVAQSSVPAAIFRSTGCGFQVWLPGVPAYLHQMVFFNNKPLTPLRSYSVPVCFDTCHRACGVDACEAGTCIALDGNVCNCLDSDDLPFDAQFQLYDGDPCGGGVPITGTQVNIPITEAEIPPETIGDGTSKCFDLTAVVDPKVEVPEEVWLEATLGHDDAWALFGRANLFEGQGFSNISGIDDGVECTTICFRGDPLQCRNDPEFCDSLIPEVDSNAEVLFSLRPVPPPAETKHAETYTYRIEGNEAILARGGEPVFFEIRVGDFDPEQTGIVLRGWEVGIDSSGYFSATRGTLTPSRPACVPGGEDCTNQNGPGSICNEPQEVVPNVCMAGFIDFARSDYVFFEQSQLAAINRTSLNYLFGATTPVGWGSVSRREGYYLASLVLHVSPNAKGTFTIGLAEPPRTKLFEDTSHFLPLLSSVPGKITVETGRCCVAFGDDCVDDLTRDECAAEGGVFAVNQTCSQDPCPIVGACCDSLAPGGVCKENVTEADCTAEHLSWFGRTRCGVVTCDEATGACCVEGVCTNDVARSECPNDVWLKGLPCDEPGVTEACELKALVPAASVWGLAVLGLGLLIGSRVHFRRRWHGA